MIKKKVIKEYDGKRWVYSYCGNRRCSKREFKYACIAFYNGCTWLVSLGNDKNTTYRSKYNLYAHWCDKIEVVEIIEKMIASVVM